LVEPAAVAVVGLIILLAERAALTLEVRLAALWAVVDIHPRSPCLLHLIQTQGMLAAAVVVVLQKEALPPTPQWRLVAAAGAVALHF
jgi:hypothetical protein